MAARYTFEQFVYELDSGSKPEKKNAGWPDSSLKLFIAFAEYVDNWKKANRGEGKELIINDFQGPP